MQYSFLAFAESSIRRIEILLQLRLTNFLSIQGPGSSQKMRPNKTDSRANWRSGLYQTPRSGDNGGFPAGPSIRGSGLAWLPWLDDHLFWNRSGFSGLFVLSSYSTSETVMSHSLKRCQSPCPPLSDTRRHAATTPSQ